VSAADYQARVAAACGFLEGRAREVIGDIEQKMQEAAANLDFERAADLRDLLQAIRQTLSKTRRFVRSPNLMPTGDNALADLTTALALPHAPQVIECFDISHISGSFCVASMVRFRAGRPDRAQYRRFKIQSFIGNDDFRAMEEVVGRRYTRLAAEGHPLPDLVVIDGGLGQVGAALRAFASIGVAPPALIGLAKKHETVFFADGRPPLQLPGNHPGRLLLQRIRDEAHRFANTFNAELRRQRLRESALDSIPGLGPVRRRALLAHFKTIERLRAASPATIAALPGFSTASAQSILDALNQP
jgi:excinuclease ABC subunit C